MKYIYLGAALMLPLPFLFRRGSIGVLPYRVYALVMSAATLVKGAATPPWLDFLANRLEHFLVLAMASAMILYPVRAQGGSDRAPWALVLMGTGLAAVLGLAIEAIQLGARWPGLAPGSPRALALYTDSLWDLGADLAGGALAGWWAWRGRRGGSPALSSTRLVKPT